MYSDACWDPVEKAYSELSRAYTAMTNEEHYSGVLASLTDASTHIEDAINIFEEIDPRTGQLP